LERKIGNMHIRDLGLVNESSFFGNYVRLASARC